MFSLTPQVGVALIATIVALATSLIATGIGLFVAERKLRHEYRLEFAAERVAHKLLKHKIYSWRSMNTIKSFIGGFEDDELRRILVRAGAVRFVRSDDVEFWGLLSRIGEVRPPLEGENLSATGAWQIQSLVVEPQSSKLRGQGSGRNSP